MADVQSWPLSSEPVGPACPVDKGGDRLYYKAEIAKVAKRIKLAYKKIAEDELRRRPELANNIQWRKSAQCGPDDILRNLDRGFFFIRPRYGHDKAIKDQWVAYFTNHLQ